MKKISIIIPAMNEEGTLGMVLDDVGKAKRIIEDNYEVEVIVVDDHSSDRTPEIAYNYGVTLIRNTMRPGKGCALRAGFEAADGDIFVMLDADYSHRAEDIPVFIEEVNNGAGLVIGSRIFGGSDEFTRVRAFGNIFLNFFIGFFLGRYLSDGLNGFKAFRSEIFRNFTYTSREFEIEIEIIANALRSSLPVKEVSSHERSRAGGEIKSNVIKHGTKFLLRIIREYIRNVLIMR